MAATATETNMIWPFISRKKHLQWVELHQEVIRKAAARVASQEDIILRQEIEITRLNSILSPGSVMITPDTPEDSPKRPINEDLSGSNRAGWRYRAQHATLRTVPVVKDSAVALQKRVEEQGGK